MREVRNVRFLGGAFNEESVPLLLAMVVALAPVYQMGYAVCRSEKIVGQPQGSRRAEVVLSHVDRCDGRVSAPTFV